MMYLEGVTIPSSEWKDMMILENKLQKLRREIRNWCTLQFYVGSLSSPLRLHPQPQLLLPQVVDLKSLAFQQP
jgi:hypothetical protein